MGKAAPAGDALMAESAPIPTPRLILEPFGEKHLHARYVAWLNDPETVRYSEQRFRKHTLESCREYWRSFAGTPHFLWAMVSRDASLGHIGNFNAYVDGNHGIADLGILLGSRETRGLGLGSEAWLAVCGFLFREQGIRKVTAGTLSGNGSMLGIMRKAGMREDGRRSRHYLLDGEEADLVHAALFREDWEGRR